MHMPRNITPARGGGLLAIPIGQHHAFGCVGEMGAGQMSVAMNHQTSLIVAKPALRGGWVDVLELA